MSKIILLGPAYPYRGGIAAFTERLSEQFIAEGHDVEIKTFTLQYPSFLFPGKTQYSEDAAPAQLNIERLVHSVNPFNWISVGRQLKRMKPDLLVIPFWMPFMAPCFGTIARIVRQNKHTRVVAVMHNLIPHEPRPMDRPFARYFVRHIDAAVTLSQSVLHDLHQLAPSLPSVFSPHPLYDHYGARVSHEEACRNLQLEPSCRYLLFFGLIRDYKGLDLLLRAFADNRLNRQSHLRLLIAGEFYGDGEKYHALAKEMGVEDRIVWRTHFISNEEVRYYFSAADIVVQPYKTATQSGVTQIAYHFEQPMLVTNVGGLPEIVPHGKVGYAVEPSPDAIADALAEFTSLTEPDKVFSEGIRDEKQKYAWDTMSRAILELS